MYTPSSLRSLRRLAGVALPGVLLAAAPGCGHNSVVGRWQGKLPLGNNTSQMVVEFKPDGTDTRTIKALTGTNVLSDTYALKDDTLQITPKGLAIDGKSYGLPSLYSAPENLTMKFINSDTLSLTMDGQPQPFTLTRVKP
jgi:hypothetical protein